MYLRYNGPRFSSRPSTSDAAPGGIPPKKYNLPCLDRRRSKIVVRLFVRSAGGTLFFRWPLKLAPSAGAVLTTTH